MPQPQNVIAVLWDFDGTLIAGSMQDVILEHYHVNKAEFWREVNGLPEYYRQRRIDVVPDICHLNHLLTYVREGKIPGLNNQLLRELGSRITFYPGLPDFFGEVKRRVAEDETYRPFEIKVEHYILSAGIHQMIVGSAIMAHVDGVWGCQFIESPAPPGYSPELHLSVVPGNHQPKKSRRRSGSAAAAPQLLITQIGYPIDSRSKNNILYDINKGSNVHPQINVNDFMPDEERRIPFTNMIYVADGPSDTSCFSVVRRSGGKCFAVYDRDSSDQLRQAMMLQEVGRVNSIGPADYRPGEQAYLWIREAAVQIADRIAREKRAALDAKVVPAARHIVADSRSREEQAQTHASTAEDRE